MNRDKLKLLTQPAELTIEDVKKDYYYQSAIIDGLDIRVMDNKYTDTNIFGENIVQVQNCLLFFSDNECSIHKIMYKKDKFKSSLLGIIKRDNKGIPSLINYISKAISLGYIGKGCRYSFKIEYDTNKGREEYKVPKMICRQLGDKYFIAKTSNTICGDYIQINKSYLIDKSGDYCNVIKTISKLNGFGDCISVFPLKEISKIYGLIVKNTQDTYFLLDANLIPVLSSKSEIDIMYLYKSIKTTGNGLRGYGVAYYTLKDSKELYAIIRGVKAQSNLQTLSMYNLTNGKKEYEFTSSEKIEKIRHVLNKGNIEGFNSGNQLVKDLVLEQGDKVQII